MAAMTSFHEKPEVRLQRVTSLARCMCYRSWSTVHSFSRTCYTNVHL